MLVRHAPTSATRSFAFPTDEPLDDRGRAAAFDFGAALAERCETLSSPALRCRQTIEAACLGDARIVNELAECDFGAWGGRRLADVHAADAGAAESWMKDPRARPHGGESLTTFMARIGDWLDREARLEGGALAVTHGGVVKAAVVHALGAPVEAFWRLEVSPLAVTELHCHDGRWTVARVNCAP